LRFLGISDKIFLQDNKLQKNALKGIVMRTLYELLKNQNGATAIEYALIAVASIKPIGPALSNNFNNVSSNLTR